MPKKSLAKPTGGNRTASQVSLNWLVQQPGKPIPIIGARKVSHLEDNLSALDFTLSAEQIDRLNQSSNFDLPFSAAAAQGEILINATHGIASLEALKMAGVENLQGKILIDVANELDFSQGMPPRSLATDVTSLGEKIQATFPDTKVVKTLNTMNCQMMVDPKQLDDGNHTVFISGNDADAKSKVTELLQSFGWIDIFDLGDITSARATEMLMPIWLRVFGKLGNVPYNFKVVVG